MTDFTKEFIVEARESITEPGVERYICIPVQLEMLDEIERLQSRIAELEEKQRWRVVADGELPEVYRDEDGDFIRFLVCEGDGGYPFIAMYNGINWWAGIFVPDITHWMPLPELPEVQE